MLTFGSHVDGYYDVADQMIHHLRRRAEEAFRRREAERETLTSVAEFEKYRARMRENFLRAIGGLPAERTPLQAKVTGKIERDGYSIEKTVFWSLPGVPVTAALYLPANAKGPSPAVLFVCGHAREAKAYPQYQRVCSDLAANGFVVLAVDPPGQGERMQYLHPETGHEMIGWGTREHSYVGMQFYTAGFSPARQFLWDGMRGVDYLCSRPEVDASRIGVTGNSGGGTQTSWLMLAEPRLAAAAPGTFIMDYENYLRTGQPQDAEQNLYRSFADGPDHDDYVTAMAPKPVLVLAAAYDFFPIEGTLKTVERAKRIYTLYGKAGNVDVAAGPHVHEYSHVLRQAAVNWFRVHLQGAAPDFVTKVPECLSEEALDAADKGQVLLAFPDARTLHDLLRDEMRRTCPERKKLPGEAGIREQAGRVRKLAAETLGVAGDRSAAIFPRIIADAVVDGYRTEKLFFFSEKDVVVTGIFIHPRGGVGKGTELLLLDRGTCEIPERRPEIEAVLAGGRNVFVLDVRGVGGVQTRPVSSGAIEGNHGTEWVLGCNAMKLGLSTLGLRTFDVLRGYDYLASRADAGPVYLHGFGMGATMAWFAAAIEERFAGLTVEDFVPSYRAMAESRFYDERLLSFKTSAFGILRAFDLVDLLPAIAPRPLLVARPLTPRGLPMAAADFEATFVATAEEAGYLPGGWRPEVVNA